MQSSLKLFFILKIKSLTANLKHQLQAKSEELNSFKEQHNIKTQAEKQTELQKEDKTSGIEQCKISKNRQK